MDGEYLSDLIIADDIELLAFSPEELRLINEINAVNIIVDINEANKDKIYV